MQNLVTEIKNLDSLLDSVNLGLENLSSANFDSEFAILTEKMKKVSSIKASLKEKLNPKEFSILDGEFNKKAKLIQINYDNIIRRYQHELGEVQQALRNISNQKKLAKYKR